ncbi:MAG: hypothetical protein ABIK28_12140 [Planctomycetota bacterium]
MLFRNDLCSCRSGCIYNYLSAPYLLNCTLLGNTAKRTGGGLVNRYGSESEALNCIFWGNAPDEIVSGSGNTMVINFSNIQEGHVKGNQGIQKPEAMDPDSPKKNLTS